ncbi:hypothetical protein DRQ33_05220 [bacterium]|nr:MAG: hypothetical protein DRQ33_05220 [bacterium]
MKNSSIIITMAIILSSGLISGIEITAPMRWHCEGHLLRFVPRTERNFTEGMLDNSVDLLSAKFDDDIELDLFAGATIWTGMGYQWEDIVFDPRDMHYSLAPGFRAKLWQYLLTFQWLHDCFHEVDRKTEPTIIWNAYELRFSPHKYISYRRREIQQTQIAQTVEILPSFDWEIYFAIFPRLHEIFWFQYKHPFSTHSGANLYLGLLKYRTLLLEFDYTPTLWTKYGGGVCHRQYFQLAITYFAKYGTFTTFWGYTAYENQPIRPQQHLVKFGFNWKL